MSTLPSSSAYFFYANLKEGGEEMAEINELSIKVSADVKRASDSLRNLNGVLLKLGSNLSSVNNGQFAQLSSGLDAFATSAQKLATIKKTDFNKLVTSLNSLSSINTSGIMTASVSIERISSALSGVNSASFSQAATDIGNLGVGIRSLGYKTTASAIQNLPQLTVELQNLFNAMSTAPTVNQNTIDFTNALARLAATGRSAGAATRNLNNALNQQNRETTRVNSSTKSLASTIGKLYATYFWITRLTRAMFKFTDSAMDTYEALNYFNVAIDKVASSAMNEWKEAGYSSADSYYNSFSDRLSGLLGQMTGYSTDNRTLTMLNAKSLGMNISELTQASASFLQIADSIGMTGESALNTSKALSMLSADWSSLRNISTSDAMQKMESALVGQSRAVRSLGIDITQASLQEEAYRLGVTKSVSVMTQQEKSLLRVITMLKQSKVAYGDLAKTIDSPANQVRMLQAAMANLARTIGSLVMPVLSAILPYITGFTIAINRALVALGNFLGVDWSQNITSLKGGSDALGDLEDSIDDVTGAAEKMNKSTRGWDELNNLTTSKGGGAGGADETGLLNGALAEALAEYEKKWNEAFNEMESKAQKVADTLTALGNNRAFQYLTTGIVGFLGTLAVFKVGGWAMTALEFIRTNLSKLATMKNIDIAIQVAGLLVTVKFAQNVSNDIIDELKEKYGSISWNEIFESSIDALGPIGVLWSGFVGMFSDDYGVFNNFGEWINALVSPEMWQDVASNWSTGWGILKETWVTGWQTIVDWWNNLGIVKWFKEYVAPWFTAEKWQGNWKELKSSWTTGWQTISDWWNNLWFVKWWNGLKKKFSFSNMQTAFQNIKDGFKDAWQKAVDGAKAIWNKFAEWLNNKLTFTIPSLEMFGQQIVEGKTIQLANLPTFSTGGFPEDGLFMANHNELVGQFGNGQTAVANNTQIIQGIENGVYRAMMRAMDGNGGLKVEIDGKEVFSVVQKQSRNYKRMTGVPAF